MIKKQLTKFNWGGNGATLSRLKKVMIMLPVCNDDTPDYAYMEKYMKSMEKKILLKYKNYLSSYDSKVSYNKKMHEHNWNVLDINEVFPEIKRGRRLKTEDHIKGEMPYVSSSAMDNGVDDFVSNKEGVRIFSDCLSLANSGSVGATFYHPYEFVASDHITKLKNPNANKYVYLYLATITRQLSDKYSFNREINEGRLNREKIFIPVNNEGKPDFDYMETYMREIENKILKKYIEIRLTNL